MNKKQIKTQLSKFVRSKDCFIAKTLTANKIAKKIGCSKEKLNEFIREEYSQTFNDWRDDPGVILGYPECITCRKHRRGRPFGHRGEAYQCLVCGNISEKKRTFYHTDGTTKVSDSRFIALPTGKVKNN